MRPWKGPIPKRRPPVITLEAFLPECSRKRLLNQVRPPCGDQIVNARGFGWSIWDLIPNGPRCLTRAPSTQNVLQPVRDFPVPLSQTLASTTQTLTAAPPASASRTSCGNHRRRCRRTLDRSTVAGVGDQTRAAATVRGQGDFGGGGFQSHLRTNQ